MPEKSQELFSQYVGEKIKFKESGHRAEMYNILKCMEPPAPVVTACKDTGHILKSVSSFEILGSPNCVVH